MKIPDTLQGSIILELGRFHPELCVYIWFRSYSGTSSENKQAGKIDETKLGEGRTDKDIIWEINKHVGAIRFTIQRTYTSDRAMHIWWGNIVMMTIGQSYLIPLLRNISLPLIGIGFACIVADVPGSDLILPGGLFNYATEVWPF